VDEGVGAAVERRAFRQAEVVIEELPECPDVITDE
jgi:hypothetical protein